MLSTDPLGSPTSSENEQHENAEPVEREKEPLSIMRLASWGGLFAIIALAGFYYAWMNYLNIPLCRFLITFLSGTAATDVAEHQAWAPCLLIGTNSVARILLIFVISIMTGVGVWLADFARKRRGSFTLAVLFAYVFLGIISLVERFFPPSGSLPISETTIEVALIATALAGLPATLGYYFRRLVVGDESASKPVNLSETPGSTSELGDEVVSKDE